MSFAKKDWTKSQYEKWMHDNEHLLGGAIDRKESSNMFHVFSKELMGSGSGTNAVTEVMHTEDGKPVLVSMDGSALINGGAVSASAALDEHNFEQLNPLEPAPILSLDSIAESVKDIKPIERINQTGGQGAVALDQTYESKVQHEYDYMKPAYWNQFGPDTMIGYLMKPRNEGGPGFPFPTGNSIFTPHTLELS
jgi:hypothetical protein